LQARGIDSERFHRFTHFHRDGESLATGRASFYLLSVTTRMAAPRKAGAVFVMSVVTRRANVTSPISRLIPLEMSKWLRSAPRQRPSISMMRIVPVIDVAVESTRAVKPWAGANKYTADEPIRPVVAVGSAVVWGVIEVPVRAIWRRSNVHADADLSRRICAHCADEARDAQQTKSSEKSHDSPQGKSIPEIIDAGFGDLTGWTTDFLC
jgi:hypothetical protein